MNFEGLCQSIDSLLDRHPTAASTLFGERPQWRKDGSFVAPAFSRDPRLVNRGIEVFGAERETGAFLFRRRSVAP